MLGWGTSIFFVRGQYFSREGQVFCTQLILLIYQALSNQLKTKNKHIIDALNRLLKAVLFINIPTENVA